MTERTAGDDVPPLTPAEEAAWRALGRAVVVIPRILSSDLLADQGLSITEYTVMMNLSEAPDRSLRMSQLANYVSLSVSGLTRVVERLSRQGVVERVRDQADRRGQIAVLTDSGLARLVQAWPSHLASVRRRVMDHLAGVDLEAFACAIASIASPEAARPLRR